MKTIEVLGPGCANCKRLEAERPARPSRPAGIEAEVVQGHRLRRDHGPRGHEHARLVIDGKVVSYGRVPSAGDIAAWLGE